MKKAFTRISKKAALVAAIASATVVGGVTTAVVLASIPDSSGVIHGCYRNSATGMLAPKGTLRAIDTDAGEVCTAQETAITWNQQGPKGDPGETGPQGPAGPQGSSTGPTVYDANGQLLGDLMEVSGNGNTIYIKSLNRTASFSAAGGNPTIGDGAAPIYESFDCTGQAYIRTTPTNITEKLRLMRTAANSYAIVQDNEQAQTISQGSTGTLNGCNAASGSVAAYPLTPTTLPFSTPIAVPVKLAN